MPENNQDKQAAKSQVPKNEDSAKTPAPGTGEDSPIARIEGAMRSKKVSLLKSTLVGAGIGAAAGLAGGALFSPARLFKNAWRVGTPTHGAGDFAEAVVTGAAGAKFLEKGLEQQRKQPSNKPKPQLNPTVEKLLNAMGENAEWSKQLDKKVEQSRSFGLLVTSVQGAALGAVFGYAYGKYQNKPAKEYEQWQEKIREGKIPGMDSQLPGR